jgi:hypothetical protein
MAKHRPEDKKYLSKLHHVTRNWTLAEMEEMLTDFTNQ